MLVLSCCTAGTAADVPVLQQALAALTALLAAAESRKFFCAAGGGATLNTAIQGAKDLAKGNAAIAQSALEAACAATLRYEAGKCHVMDAGVTRRAIEVLRSSDAVTEPQLVIAACGLLVNVTRADDDAALTCRCEVLDMVSKFHGRDRNVSNCCQSCQISVSD